MACQGCLQPVHKKEPQIVTFNKALELVAESRPDLIEHFAAILETLPTIPMVPTYEAHRWYINLQDPASPDLIRIGNL